MPDSSNPSDKCGQDELNVPGDEWSRLFIDHAPMAFASFDREMRYLHASRSWRREYNLGDRALRGISHYLLFPDIPEVWKEAHRRAMAGEVLASEGDRFERSDGSVQWVRWKINPWRKTTGEIGGIFIFSRDITACKTAEELLRSTETRMQAIVNSAMDAIISVNEQHRIIVFNRAAEKIFQCTASEAIGSSLDRFIPLKYREAHREQVQRFGSAGVTSRSMRTPGRLTALRSNGDEFPIEATISQAQANGEKTFTVILRDITDRQRADEAMIRTEKQASVGRMAAAIAHEINNPLAAVTNALFLARTTENLPEPAGRYLQIAEDELKRVAQITRQMLGFYRESQSPAPTSVTDILRSAVDLLERRVKAKQAVIEKQWDGKVEINAVGGELRQVFSNLLANSLDAIGEGGTITLRVSEGTWFQDNRRSVRITVADNGDGMSAHTRQHIFQPFFTTKGAAGTGLGLWVCKQIIAKHGGAIRVRSRSNGIRRGTVISIILPAGQGTGERSLSARA